jgi:hypothetical protein
MTTSSRDAFPARSPMPLMVHSIWRAPARVCVCVCVCVCARARDHDWSGWEFERLALSTAKTHTHTRTRTLCTHTHAARSTQHAARSMHTACAHHAAQHTCHGARDAVCCAEAQVVLAVRGDDHAVSARRVCLDLRDELPEFVRQVPARGVCGVCACGCACACVHVRARACVCVCVCVCGGSRGGRVLVSARCG